MISVIILNYNGGDTTNGCIRSVLNSKHLNYELIVVDNGSKKDSYSWKWHLPSEVKVVMSSRNLGYAGGMNLGIKEAKGDIIICLNNDTIVHPDWLLEIELFMKDSLIGCANPTIYNFKGYKKDGYDLLAGSISKLTWFGITYDIQFGEPDYANGCCFITRRNVLRKVGLFDEGFRFFWEDVDLSLRIKKAGYYVAYIPKAVIWHIGGDSMKKEKIWRIKWWTNTSRLRGWLKHSIPFRLFTQ